MRGPLRKLALATVLRPPYVEHCSQTVYEALLGCCRMWDATGEARWAERSHALAQLLLDIQQPDGGFDIGYEFNFGQIHEKGQSTSPELVALVALSEYARLFEGDSPDGSSVAAAAGRAAEWVRYHALDIGDGRFAIAYSPLTVNEVMVYNGTSFACGALGCYLGTFGSDDGLRRIYEGMVRYLRDVLATEADSAGAFWYYCEQSRADLDDVSRRKVDYYHQMQQVEVHALAQQRSPVDEQAAMIRDAADHVAALGEVHRVIPYCNGHAYFKGLVHLWGLSSVVPGMLEAAAAVPDRAEAYRAVALKTLDWILEYGWNGDHFEATLTAEGAPLDHSPYMVRSDAWVFNSLGAAQKEWGEGPWTQIAEACYGRMAAVDFSGPESHASRKLTRALVGAYAKLKA